MSNHELNAHQASYLLWIFLATQLCLWTLTPFFVRYNLPMDAIEGSIWGRQLEWGYDKNPFLNGWLTALAMRFGGSIFIYFFSQLSVVLCMLAVWLLGKKMFNPTIALLAVMLLIGMQYYNFHAIDFNDNTLELALWAFTTYFFYSALTTKNTIKEYLFWASTGLMAGLGMMAKYYTAILLCAMLLFLLSSPQTRKVFYKLPVYFGISIFLIIILPHLLWLPSHDYVTVKYVFLRVDSKARWINHLLFPAKFAYEQLQVFLPTFIFFLLLFLGRKPLQAIADHNLNTFNKRFLFWVGLGPLLLTLLLSLSMGITLRAGWGMPLLSYSTLMLFALYSPRLSAFKIKWFVGFIFIVMCLQALVYAFVLTHSNTKTSANFPGKIVADKLTQEWHARFKNHLQFVAGSRWISGNIEYYSKDHPQVFIQWNKILSPWIDNKKLRRQGGIFVWDVSKGETLPAEITTAYPNLQIDGVYQFSWLRNGERLAPIKIGVAYLSPGA